MCLSATEYVATFGPMFLFSSADWGIVPSHSQQPQVAGDLLGPFGQEDHCSLLLTQQKLLLETQLMLIPFPMVTLSSQVFPCPGGCFGCGAWPPLPMQCALTLLQRCGLQCWLGAGESCKRCALCRPPCLRLLVWAESLCLAQS